MRVSTSLPPQRGRLTSGRASDQCTSASGSRATSSFSRAATTKRPVGDHDYDLTARGIELLTGLGVDVAGLRRQRRAFARRCLDWTERRPHLSGALGAALLVRLLDLGWLVGGRVPRGLVVTDAGRDGLLRAFGCDAAVLQDQASGG